MKKFALTFVLLLVTVNAFGAKQSYIVDKILEGNLIQLDNGESVKLIGLSVPHDQKELSKDYLNRLLLGRRVTLKYDEEEVNEHGQKQAYVYIIETFINASVISAGYAEPEKDIEYRHKALFESLYQQAKHYQRGLWKQ